MRRCSGTAPPAAPTRSSPTGARILFLERHPCLPLVSQVGGAIAQTPAVRCRLYDAVVQAQIGFAVAWLS